MKAIIFLFLFSNIFISAQSNFAGIIEYQSTINGKKLDEYIKDKRDKVKNKNVISSLDKVYFYAKPITSSLSFSDKKGVYIVEDKLSLDASDLGQKILKTSSGGSKEYFFDDENKLYLIKDCETIDECVVYRNAFLEWTLTQESKTINGYTAFKATRAKNKVIAWYTPQIPINFGPKGEYGLPGLILELEIGNIIFKASKITLNPKEKPIINFPDNTNIMSNEEFNAIVKKMTKSIFGDAIKD